MAALINPYGAPATVVEAVMSGRVIAVVCQHLIDELTAVLLRPKLRRWVSVADAVAFVEALGGTADVQPDPVDPQRRVRDPGDDYLVALAEAAAAVIVTGDTDLLDAGLTPPAMTPRDLMNSLPR